jgi:hypothetical protein
MQVHVPQGTIAGIDESKLIINDLSCDSPYAKFVDVSTVSSTSTYCNDCCSHNAADKLVECVGKNGMFVNWKRTN